MSLQLERNRATFPVNSMSHLIYGSEQEYRRFQQVQKAFGEDPELKFDINFFNMSRKDQLLKATRVLPALQRVYDVSDSKNYRDTLTLPPTMMIGSIHCMMVIPGFEVLATEEQCKKWIPSLKDYSALGCYAQTELGHGSDVQNLETTGTFDPSTQEIILHTPTVSATKFWPGDLGIFANFALVYCRIIVGSNSYGVHPVWAPIRNQDHDPLPGVIVGDIGPKMGYSTKDNGFLSFQNYRVPVDNLLAKFIKISPEGKVIRLGNPKIVYSSMMLTRSYLCSIWPKFAGISLTIAVRYSLVRTQFLNTQTQEIPIMDYQLQQEKLIPLVAEYYSLLFGGDRIQKMLQSLFKAVQYEDFSDMPLLHALLSGAKANYTQFIITCAEQCRLSCGGHGFAHYSGLPNIFFDQMPNVTLEGENQILNLQLAGFMLKQLKSNNKAQYFEFLKDIPSTTLLQEDITSLDQLLMLIGWNSYSLTINATNKLLSQQKISKKEAWDTKAGIMLHKAAASFTPYFNLKVFIETIRSLNDQRLAPILTQLARVYGIQTILNNMHGLQLMNLIDGDQIRQLKTSKEQLYEQIRPNLLSLVEAQGYDDNTLKSLIGGEDGLVYEKLFNYASEQNSMIQTDEHVQRGLQWIKKMREIKPQL